VVISVRNCMVGSGVDTLYCARFLTGGAFDPFVVPPCISTVAFVWLNQRLSHDYAGEEARAFSDCGCYPISTVDF